MKTTLICAGILLLFLTGRGEATTIPARVTGDNVNLRTGPTRRAEILGQLPAGTEVRVALTDREWSAIIPPEGIGGWICRDYLEDGMVTARRVNVRSGPSVSYPVLLKLEEGAKVSVLEKRDRWAKVAFPGDFRLWVSSRYLSSAVAVPAREPGSSVTAGTISRSSPPVPPPGELRSYTGIVRELAEPFFRAGREYGFELVSARHTSEAIAYLAGDTVDLAGYRYRPVRIWAETVESPAGRPALLEVKGAGFIW